MAVIVNYLHLKINIQKYRISPINTVDVPIKRVNKFFFLCFKFSFWFISKAQVLFP